MPNPVRPPRPALLAAVAALALLPAAARADQPKVGLIVFKDGSSLQGYVVREKKTIIDQATGQPMQLAEGFFLVDDLARRIIFSPSRIEKVSEDQTFNPEEGAIINRREIDLSFAKPLPPIRKIVEAGAFDEKWDRDFRYETTDRIVVARQHLAVLSPYYARLDGVPRLVGHALAMPYRWNSCYLTRELGPEQVLNLLATSPDYRDSRELKEEERAIRRVKVAQFMLQAGWAAEAQEELERLARELPGQKERAETGLEAIKKVRAAQRADDLRVAYRAGQYAWVAKQVADFPEEGVDERTLADVRGLRADVEAGLDGVKLARHFLKELPDAVVNGGQARWLAPAAAAIGDELTPGGVGRLKTFLDQAQQAEQQRKNGATPELGPAQLLGLAVSGWLLGDTAAESKVEVAERLWRTRQLVLEYQKTASRGDRQKLLYDYERRGSDAIPLDELGQMIRLLPPPEPEEKLDRAPREVQVGGSELRGPKYWLQLPREYSHGRPCPVLLVLHQVGEKPEETLEHWGEYAERHGYILAAPEWAEGTQTEYTFSAREHATVLDTLRDLRRHYAVDNDRVFLAGWGQGGDMAYDVGLAHPDLFAGVVPMSAFPGPWPYRYRHNGQYLPFYVINGDRSGDSRDNKAMFQEWVPHGYPVLYVQYRGRGVEWFGGELPALFDWMDRQRRAHPTNELGRLSVVSGDEFLTMRPGDNRFYWLSTDAIDERQLNEGPRFNPRPLGATLQANRRGNDFTVRTQGIKQVTVWLGSGDGTADFDKPVTVYLNTVKRWDRKVTPSRETLLEDFYARGDRQQLVVARIDLEVR
jgi:pimeloyl-ACP methyl ester carboxylesterase